MADFDSLTHSPSAYATDAHEFRQASTREDVLGLTATRQPNQPTSGPKLDLAPTAPFKSVSIPKLSISAASDDFLELGPVSTCDKTDTTGGTFTRGQVGAGRTASANPDWWEQ